MPRRPHTSGRIDVRRWQWIGAKAAYPAREGPDLSDADRRAERGTAVDGPGRRDCRRLSLPEVDDEEVAVRSDDRERAHGRPRPDLVWVLPRGAAVFREL